MIAPRCARGLSEGRTKKETVRTAQTGKPTPLSRVPFIAILTDLMPPNEFLTSSAIVEVTTQEATNWLSTACSTPGNNNKFPVIKYRKKLQRRNKEE
jgi:hypothetical protein